MRSALFSTAVLLLGTGLAQTSKAVVHDPAAEFSLAGNPNGVWTYGYAQTLGGTLIPHAETFNYGSVDEWFTELSAYGYLLPGIYHNRSSAVALLGTTVSIPPGALMLHPGQANQYSILRFTAPADDQYSMAGFFYGMDFAVGVTTDVHILGNGITALDGFVNGFGLGTGPSFGMTEATKLRLNLQAGDQLDFAVGFGSNGSFFFDSTGLSLQITTGSDTPRPAMPDWAAVPESGSTAFLVILALTWLHRCPRSHARQGMPIAVQQRF